MRTVALVFATLFLLATAGLGVLAANRGIKDAGDISQIVGSNSAEIAAMAKLSPEAAQLAKLAEQTGRLKAGAVLLGVAGLLALALLVVTFAGKAVVPKLAIGVVAAVAIGTFLSPQYNLGPLAPASARNLGYAVSVLALIGAGAAWGATVLKQRRATGAAPRALAAAA